jgi:predicted regulator of Ras-like GTPase activity (Roadblock/LC7/MglB family)
MVILEADHERFVSTLTKLSLEANAKFCFLVDRAGQQIAAAGELADVDPTALASLTAGNVAATEGVAQLVGEREFTTLFHEGTKEHLHISLICNRFILLVAFDERSSLGLVRLRVSQFVPELGEAANAVIDRADGPHGQAGAVAFQEITDEDIDALFG